MGVFTVFADVFVVFRECIRGFLWVYSWFFVGVFAVFADLFVVFVGVFAVFADVFAVFC